MDEYGRSLATGKRKTSVARVWLKPGAGHIMVNQQVGVLGRWACWACRARWVAGALIVGSWAESWSTIRWALGRWAGLCFCGGREMLP